MVPDIEPDAAAVYLISVTPIALGQPVTIQLPANKALDVGAAITSDGKNTYTRNNAASNTLTVKTTVP